MELSTLENKALKTLLAMEASYSKEIQKQLLSALTSIYGEMGILYSKYAKGGKLTKAEMTKYNKYATMEKDILKKLDPALKANIQTIKKLLPKQFQESFYHYAWAIDNATELRLSWGQVNTNALLQAFDITNPKNIELINSLKNYDLEARKRIRAALLNGLTIGKSYDQMARDLKKQLEKIYSSAIKIIRTEGQSAINAGQSLAYLRAKDNGINGEEVWTSTKDGKTRQTHRNMDGKKKNKEGFFNVNGEKALYPGDPNLSAKERIHCRCTLRFEIEGYEPQLMRTREEGVIPYMPYNQYAEEYHPEWLPKK